jgi:hypothetical protein
MLRMRKIALLLGALTLFVASPAAAKSGAPGDGSKAFPGDAPHKPTGPPPGKGFSDGH